MALRKNAGVRLTPSHVDPNYDVLCVVKAVLDRDRYEVELVDGPDPRMYGKILMIHETDIAGRWTDKNAGVL